MKRVVSINVVALLLGGSLMPLAGRHEAFCQVSQKRSAQVTHTDKIDAYITKQMQARRIPGLAFAVVEDGKVTLKKAYGIDNLETDTPVKVGSIFHVASITKQFTAAAIMMLVEQGKVRLDDSITTYLNPVPEAWAKITVRHLLTHTSGIMPGPIIRVDDQGRLTMRAGTALLDITATRALEVMAREPLLFPPGERIMYCDAGYFLLGLVIEKASAQPYQGFMQERFFEPLHMSNSSILDRWKIVKGSVPVYTIRNGQLAPWRRDWQYEVNAFAGICSTVEDLAKWDEALRAGKLLKQTSLDLMWTPAKLNNGQEALMFGEAYGFGWTLGEVRGYRTVEHGGASGTYILRFRDDGLTIIVLTNLDVPSGSQPSLLARGIAGLVKPQYQPSDMLTRQTDPSPQTTREINAMLSEMAEERDSPIMTEPYRTFYNNNPGPFRQDDARLLKTLRSLTYLSSDDVAGRGLKRMGEPVARIAYYKGEMNSKTFYFTFWLTKDREVAHLRFNPE
jgi:CubicO group peptidase (beta-lactamase class C family)